MLFFHVKRITFSKILAVSGIVSLLVAPMFSVTGCSTNTTGAEVTQQRLNGIMPKPMRPVVPAKPPGLHNPVRAHDPNYVAQLARTVPGVEASFVMIASQTAYVGLQINKGYSPAQRMHVEQGVRQRIIAGTAGIRTVRITTDLGVIAQLRHISREIANGKPFASFSQALDRMFAHASPNRPLG